MCLRKINEKQENTNFMWVCPKRECPPNYYADCKDNDGNPLSPNRFEPLKSLKKEPVKNCKKPKKSKKPPKIKSAPKLDKFLSQLTQISPEEYVGKPWCIYCHKSIENHQCYNYCESCN